MTVFSELCQRAHDRGVQRITFSCDLLEFLCGPSPGTGQEKSWRCSGFLEGFEVKVEGRTGEEALRNLVFQLEGS